MAERTIHIPVSDVTLEARIDERSGPEAVLLCHPHPLYGGSLDNNVVSVLQSALAEWGWTTLRFNSRGVGESGGEYTAGERESEDLFALADFLRERGKSAVSLGGYSFGAWVLLKAIWKGFEPGATILVSPPLDFMDFEGLRPPSGPCLVVAGDRDDFCSTGSLHAWLSSRLLAECKPRVAILPNCDHFFVRSENLLEKEIVRFLLAQQS